MGVKDVGSDGRLLFTGLWPLVSVCERERERERERAYSRQPHRVTSAWERRVRDPQTYYYSL